MSVDKQATWETTKFVVRTVVLILPLLADLLLELGLTELAATLSAVLVIVDKLIHEWKAIKATGLLPF